MGPRISIVAVLCCFTRRAGAAATCALCAILAAATVQPADAQVPMAYAWTAYADEADAGDRALHEDRGGSSGAAESPRRLAPEDSLSRAARWKALRHQKAQTMEPPEPNLAERLVAFVERNRGLVLPDRLVLNVPDTHLYGVQPVLGGLSGEAGATAGLYYELPVFSTPGRQAHVQALGSLRRYWGAELIGGVEHGRWVGYGYARYAHRASESFYGIGPDTEIEDRSFYRLDEGIVGGLAGYAVNERLLIGGHLSYRTDRVGAGLADRGPSVAEAFDASPPPGISRGTDFGVAGVFAEFDSRNDTYNRTYGRRFAPTEDRLRGISLDATRGYYLAASLTHHQDLATRQYSYSRLTVDAQQYVSLEHGMQRGLAFRQFVSVAESPDQQDIPFYRMQSIGGSTSLRGFTGGRFRDRNVVLTTAEMRCHIWHRLDMALFADAGQVFSKTSELSMRDMKVGYGVGFRFRSSQGVVARFEIARSVEGFSTYLKFGSIL